MAKASESDGNAHVASRDASWPVTSATPFTGRDSVADAPGSIASLSDICPSPGARRAGTNSKSRRPPAETCEDAMAEPRSRCTADDRASTCRHVESVNDRDGELRLTRTAPIHY